MNDLATEAAALDAGAALDARSSGQAATAPEPLPAGAPGPAPEPKIDYVPMLAATLDTAAFALEPLYPFVRKHYHHDQNVAISHAVVDLCDAYGLDLEKLLGKLLLWLNLVTVVGIPALGCIAELRAAQMAAGAGGAAPGSMPAKAASGADPLHPDDPARTAKFMSDGEFVKRKKK